MGGGGAPAHAARSRPGVCSGCPCRRQPSWPANQAANQTELAEALREIIDKVGSQDPCLIPLEESQLPTPSASGDLYSLIVVYINDEPVPHDDTNTWMLADGGVKFVGATCDRILASTDRNPVKLEVRAVQRK